MEEYKGSTGEIPGRGYSAIQMDIRASYSQSGLDRNYFLQVR